MFIFGLRGKITNKVLANACYRRFEPGVARQPSPESRGGVRPYDLACRKIASNIFLHARGCEEVCFDRSNDVFDGAKAQPVRFFVGAGRAAC